PVFARAQELLQENKVRARRRTIAPSLVQGLVSCRRCGYALSRASTRSSARLIHYYRCLGSDGWRHLGGPRCTSRPVRQDLLDATVWTEVMRLLEDPTVIQQELDRRLAVARAADPTKQRERTLERDLVRVGKSLERMLTAYQEDLMWLEQLRERMPLLRQREQSLRTELQSIADQTRERAMYLRLAETLSMFLGRLRTAADTLDTVERQRIVRLVVKEVLVDDDTIVIRHCIPVPLGPSNGSGPPTSRQPGPGERRSYLLRSGSGHAALRNALSARGLQHHSQEPQHRIIAHPRCHFHQYDVMPYRVEIGFQVQVDDVGFPMDDRLRHPLGRHVRGLLRPVAVGPRLEVGFENRFQDEFERTLDHPIAD